MSYDPVRPKRQEAFKAMFDEMQEGFGELLRNGWDPAQAKEIIERELGPYDGDRRRAA